jgi:NAD(P)-dependent dehydrogenase (short-subunit alcohol dehydrogenase family)
VALPSARSDEEHPKAEKIYHPARPLGCKAEPIEIANVVTYLAADEASFITGAAISSMAG